MNIKDLNVGKTYWLTHARGKIKVIALAGGNQIIGQYDNGLLNIFDSEDFEGENNGTITSTK